MSGLESTVNVLVEEKLEAMEPQIINIVQQAEKKSSRPIFIGSCSSEELRKFRINIEIRSVAYLDKDNRGVARCVVLVKVDFEVPSPDVIEEARVPFSIHALEKSPDAPATHEHLDVEFRFPEDELVPTCLSESIRTTKVDPNIKAPTPIGGIGFSGLGRTLETKGPKVASFQVQGIQRERREREPPKIEWVFRNNDNDFFPGSCTLLFVVSSTEAEPDGTFPFMLKLESDLTIKVRKAGGIRWRLKKSDSLPRDGWVTHMEGNHTEHLAFETFEKVSAVPAEKCIGLEAAIRPYLYFQGVDARSLPNGSS